MIPALRNNSMLTIDNSEKNKTTDTVKHNLLIIIIYSLFLAIAFALNNFVNIFFIQVTGNKSGIMFDFIYLIILMFSLISVCYFANIKIGF